MAHYDEIIKYYCWCVKIEPGMSPAEQTALYNEINTMITDLHNAGEEIDLETIHFTDPQGCPSVRIELTCPNGVP